MTTKEAVRLFLLSRAANRQPLPSQAVIKALVFPTVVIPKEIKCTS